MGRERSEGEVLMRSGEAVGPTGSGMGRDAESWGDRKRAEAIPTQRPQIQGPALITLLDPGLSLQLTLYHLPLKA